MTAPTAPFPLGPRGHLLSGNLPEFGRDRLGFMTFCARTYGDTVRLRLRHRRVSVLVCPNVIQEVLIHRSRDFMKHFALRLNPLVLGKGLLTSEADFWLRQRRLIQPAFQKSRIATYAPDMLGAARRVLDDWQPGQRREILSEMERLALMIAGKTLFGAEAEAEAQEVRQALEYLMYSYLRRFNRLLFIPLWIPTPHNLRIRRAIRRLDAIIYRFIRERRQSGTEGNDLLSILLRARDEDDGS